MSKDKAKKIIKNLEDVDVRNIFINEIYKEVLPLMPDLDIELPGVKLKNLIGTIVAHTILAFNQKLVDPEE